MIRRRRLLERGRAHPVLGPVILIALVLILGLLFVHAAHDGPNVATEVGAFCFAIAVFLGVILLERLRSLAPAPLIRTRRDRGPPAPRRLQLRRPRIVAATSLAIPLRR